MVVFILKNPLFAGVSKDERGNAQPPSPHWFETAQERLLTTRVSTIASATPTDCKAIIRNR
jgi:hypothetical protein